MFSYQSSKYIAGPNASSSSCRGMYIHRFQNPQIDLRPMPTRMFGSLCNMCQQLEIGEATIEIKPVDRILLDGLNSILDPLTVLNIRQSHVQYDGYRRKTPDLMVILQFPSRNRIFDAKYISGFGQGRQPLAALLRRQPSPCALGRAQARGLAEADPRNDTEGWDTASKLLILANFGLDAGLTMDDLTVEGIGSITERQIVAWREQRLVPKLVGSFTRADGETRAAVGVRTYPLTDPLAQVSGKNKAIRITTDAMGETIAIGSGTEPLATAAAALKDLEHILTTRRAGTSAFPVASS